MALLKLSNKRYHQTVVLITHDEKIALEADRIILIEDGKIVSQGKNSPCLLYTSCAHRSHYKPCIQKDFAVWQNRKAALPG